MSSAEAGPITAIFGGSFNPPHLAHVLALSVIHARFDVAKILVIPTFQHPFAKTLAPYEDRVTMCQLAMGWLPRVEVSRIEEELGGSSKTLHTIEELRERMPNASFRLVIGADIMVESTKWFRFDRIRELAPPIVLGRVGVSFDGAPPAVLPAISSTEVRAALAAGRIADIEPLVPRAVIEYATAHSLYSARLIMKVFILGAGKVGRALAHGLEKQGVDVTLHPARKVLPTKPIDASIIVLALRDAQLAPFAAELAKGLVTKHTVVVHNAGSLPAEAIAALRGKCAGIAQMHPMISFASTKVFPSLKHGHMHVKGDAAAEAKARKLAKKLKMTPRTFKKLDTIGYHAAAGLVANGAAALAAIGVELLAVSGVPRADAPKMLGPLLRSVAENVEQLGFPDALTGPVRRGDAAGIAKQIDVLSKKMPSALLLYLASGIAQLPIAAKLGDASKKQVDDVGAVLRGAIASAQTATSKKRNARTRA